MINRILRILPRNILSVLPLNQGKAGRGAFFTPGHNDRARVSQDVPAPRVAVSPAPKQKTSLEEQPHIPKRNNGYVMDVHWSDMPPLSEKLEKTILGIVNREESRIAAAIQKQQQKREAFETKEAQLNRKLISQESKELKELNKSKAAYAENVPFEEQLQKQKEILQAFENKWGKRWEKVENKYQKKLKAFEKEQDEIRNRAEDRFYCYSQLISNFDYSQNTVKAEQYFSRISRGTEPPAIIRDYNHSSEAPMAVTSENKNGDEVLSDSLEYKYEKWRTLWVAGLDTARGPIRQKHKGYLLPINSSDMEHLADPLKQEIIRVVDREEYTMAAFMKAETKRRVTFYKKEAKLKRSLLVYIPKEKEKGVPSDAYQKTLKAFQNEHQKRVEAFEKEQDRIRKPAERRFNSYALDIEKFKQYLSS